MIDLSLRATNRSALGWGCRAFGVAGMLLATQVAASQTVLNPVRVQRTGVAIKYSTTSAWPQVQPPKPPRPRISDNPYTSPYKRTGTINKLPVGGVLGTSNEQPKLRFGGIDFTGYFPPDCDLGVGPDHVVAAVNTTIAFYTKTGVRQYQVDYSEFFKSLGIQGEIISDPKVFYDPVTKRWFTCIIEVGLSSNIGKMLIGVSDDENPNGSWFQYRVDDVVTQGTTKYWLDYPGFGCNKDGLVITGNMFGFTSGFTGNQYMVIPKAPLLTGGSATVTSFVDATASTMKVAVTPDPTLDKIYCIGDFNTSQIMVAAITGAGTTTPKVTSTKVTVPSFTYLGGLLPTPNGNVIDGFDGRMFNASYRNGILVGAHAIRSASSDNAVCRWYQVKTNGWPTSGNNPSLGMSGNIVAPTGTDYSMPAININGRGAMSVVFTKSSPTVQADLMVASRKSTDPAGFIGAPQPLAASVGNNYFAYRWGDYFGLAVDPVDDNMFWGYGMTIASNNYWTTWVNSWKVVDVDAATTFYPTTPKMIQGTYVKGSAESLRTVDTNFYDSKSVAIANMGQSATWETSVQTNMTPTNADLMTIKWNSTGPTAATQFLFAYNWSTGAYESVVTRPVKSAQAETFEFPNGFGKYIRSDGMVKIAVRGLLPIRTTMPAAFTFRMNQLNLLGLRKS
jgi:hypothetical protein